jgi:hypothetical protein
VIAPALTSHADEAAVVALNFAAAKLNSVM